MELVLSFLWLIAVVWLLLRALRQRGALRLLLPARGSGQAASVAIIVPVRDVPTARLRLQAIHYGTTGNRWEIYP